MSSSRVTPFTLIDTTVWMPLQKKPKIREEEQDDFDFDPGKSVPRLRHADVAFQLFIGYRGSKQRFRHDGHSGQQGYLQEHGF